MAAQPRPEFRSAPGRVRLAVLDSGAWHRHAGVAVRPLLHVTRGPGAALFCVFPGVYGGHAGPGVVG